MLLVEIRFFFFFAKFHQLVRFFTCLYFIADIFYLSFAKFHQLVRHTPYTGMLFIFIFLVVKFHKFGATLLSFGDSLLNVLFC
ncbi:hypothetical protein Hdeb2414_s0679g00934561 [Helianthus debilis subsp. tardiflorus]